MDPAAEIPHPGVYDRGSWSRLGLAVEGGLVVSQLLTLYITPVVYIYMESFRHMGDKLHFRRKSKPARMPVETC